MFKRTIAILALSAGSAQAHSGHGAASEAHWLSQGDHIAVVILSAIALNLGVQLAFRRIKALRHRET